MKRISAISILGALVTLVAAQTEPVDISPVVFTPMLSVQKCLDVQGGANVDGTPVIITDCTGSVSQKWTFSGGQVKIASWNKCLDVTGGSTTPGTKLQIWDCSSGSANQKWDYGKFTYVLTWFNKGLCLDIPSGSLTNGNVIQVWTCSGGNKNQIWNTGYLSTQLPTTSEQGQTGVNNCGPTTQNCQTAWINDVDDFCLWAPPKANSGTIGDTEQIEIAWCTKSGRGTRVMPAGTLHSAHFVKTPDYVQVTGTGDFTKINVQAKDEGGELDPHGADGNGNPVGGLVYGNTFGTGLQYHEWTSFISDTEYCFRACMGPNAAENCEHIYDIMGCQWNMPANYDGGFESCDADDDLPMGVYGTSTWHQGTSPTPPPHPAAKSSNCVEFATITGGSVAPSSTTSTTRSTSTTSSSRSTTTTSTTSSRMTTSTTSSTSSSSAPAGSASVVHPGASASKCLTAASNTNGALVIVSDCVGSTAQQWTNTGTALSIYGGARCLDVTNGSTANGNKMQIWACTGGVNQQITYTTDHRLAWTGKGECLDLTDGSLTNGNQIQMWKCMTNDNNQVWNVV